MQTPTRLDGEPAIAQGVEALDHTQRPEDLLAKAIGYHLERRVFLNANHSVVLRA